MNWHRLFGQLLTDFFAGSPFDVELEKDCRNSDNEWQTDLPAKRKGART
jgi:hypothetical protein